MKAYADRMGTNPQHVRFMFDGQRVGEADTPESVSTAALLPVGNEIVANRVYVSAFNSGVADDPSPLLSCSLASKTRTRLM